MKQEINKIINSRATMPKAALSQSLRKAEGEGGCGVIGLACAEKVGGKHLLEPLKQMRNRGNGKGGGIAAVGLDPQAFGISQDLLEQDYLVGIAYIDQRCREEVEKNFIHSIFEVDHIYPMPHMRDFSSLGLSVQPPEAILYFVRVKSAIVEEFQTNQHLKTVNRSELEDEIVYQNSYRLNSAYYASAGEKRAFVLTHGKNLLVLKLVGYGDDVVKYYQLEELKAHVWIGHHRYPTKGKVWHPGGAHPFVGLHEALVHNGDFANYYSICSYLAQRNIHPLFLTDTEVAVLVFDLWHRIYKYPLENVIEALAPTTERDFSLLPSNKQSVYQRLQKMHIHGSPDGPWFFLIAQSQNVPEKAYRLIGITDTSMLRPQVFALQQGAVPIGLAASEKQAIDAALRSLAQEDSRIWDCADYYWNARGGSYQDGGAFSFTIIPKANGQAKLICSDKFENPIHTNLLKPPFHRTKEPELRPHELPDLPTDKLFLWAKTFLQSASYAKANQLFKSLQLCLETDSERKKIIEVLTRLYDSNYPLDKLRKSCLNSMIGLCHNRIFILIGQRPTPGYLSYSFEKDIPSLQTGTETLLIDASGFAAEGSNSLASAIADVYHRGFKNIILYSCRGQRFIANGLGSNSHHLHIDVYGSSGDYLASGIDGASIHVHGNAQDQLAQIMKSGSLVVHGDIGQTFMYGAKGGTAYIRGNAAGRPLINAVGKPRVVINGTCLDYLAESFMAGNPLKGGGFAILNGVAFDVDGSIIDLETPYPGNNLFSLASGGAIYLRDPGHKVGIDQLNGGAFVEMTEADWSLIRPYLETNSVHFNIPIDRLLQYNGKSLSFNKVYRKVAPSRIQALSEEEAWVKVRD